MNDRRTRLLSWVPGPARFITIVALGALKRWWYEILIILSIIAGFVGLWWIRR